MKTPEEILDGLLQSASALRRDGKRVLRFTLNSSDYDRVHESIRKQARVFPMQSDLDAGYDPDAGYFRLFVPGAGNVHVYPSDDLPIDGASLLVAQKKRPTLGDMVERESAAAHAAMDRKEAEFDKFGYGGDPAKPTPEVVGLTGFLRPSREVYVRAFRPTCAGASVEPGVEFRPGDSFVEVSERLRELLFECDPGDEHDPEKIAMPVEAAILLAWPGRAYFVEVHDTRGGWIQIFQPFGLPRNR